MTANTLASIASRGYNMCWLQWQFRANDAASLYTAVKHIADDSEVGGLSTRLG